MNPNLKPIIRWPGGKTTKLPLFEPLLSSDFAKRFCIDPCVGSGAFLFGFHPTRALISDINFQLMNVYETLRDYPSDLIAEIQQHKQKDTEDHFYEVRADFNTNIKNDVQDTVMAGNLIFLNCRCFNGLYRVNGDGKFNVGYYHGCRQPTRFENIIKRIPYLSRFLKPIRITSGSYETTFNFIERENTFVFLDTPYDDGWTGYDSATWDHDQFVKLHENCQMLSSMGCQFMHCNAATPFITDLFSDFFQYQHKIPRYINCDGNGRGKVGELVITNYHVKQQHLFDQVKK